MKTNLTLLFLLVMMISCQPKKSDSIEMSVAEAAKIDNIEDCAADTVKATAIFWIDKAETKNLYRTAKSTVFAQSKLRCSFAKTGRLICCHSSRNNRLM